jgi:NTE family protein
MEQPNRLVLALAGGNALGAYQAGAYQALHERGLRPDWIAGASIGAINGAIIAGNAPEARIEKLRQFWTLAEQFGKPDPADAPDGAGRSRFTKRAAAMQTMMTGRLGLFTPRLPAMWLGWPGMRTRVSLFDTAPMTATLRACVDFGCLNGGAVRLTATAVDVETGEDILFDTAAGALDADHLRASAAFPVAYPPVKVDGRVLVDAGVSANMPLRALLATPPEQDTLCIALDLVAPADARPKSLAEAAKRAHDLVFATQARHTIEALGREYGLLRQIRELSGAAAPASVTLLHVPYAEAANETAAKMFDFSAASIGERWAAGRRDTERALDRLASATPDGSALQAYRYYDGVLVPYR